MGSGEKTDSVTASVARPWPAFALLSLAFFMCVLDYSIVSIALPAMQHELHASPAAIQWVLSAYIMMFAGTLLLGGSLADRFGRRRFFLVGIAVFGIASLAGSFAHTVTTLIAMRAIQGLGAAMSNPSGLAIATTLFPAGPQRARALGLWAAVGSAGVVAGMVLGGLLVAFFGWPAVLWVNVPLAVVILALVPLWVPRDAKREQSPSVDLVGAILLTAALLLLTFTVVRAPEDGLISLATIARSIAIAVLFAMLIVAERRSVAPIIPGRLFRYRDFTGGAMIALVQAAGYAGMSVYASMYWQQVSGLPPLLTGLAFLPCGLIMALLIGATAAPLSARIGARTLSVAGSIVMVIAMALALYVTLLPASWPFMLAVTIVGAIGCMETFEMSMVAGLANIAEDDEGVACGTVSTMSQIGMGIGVAFAAALAIGKTAQLGIHDAFWAPLAFSVLTLAASIFGLTSVPGARKRRVLRIGKVPLLHPHEHS